jgi:adenylate kinase
MTATYILLLGLPGSGKGTLAQSLTNSFECSHISCGDVFRNHIRLQTAFGLAATKYVERGQLTPDEETSKMFLAHLSAQTEGRNYLLEGYPRTISQARDFEEHMDATRRRLGSVIYLQVGRDELLKRITARRICKTCGAIYNLLTRPPKNPATCDVDGRPLVQRSDDMPTVVASRIALYEEKEKELLSYYDEKAIIQSVNAAAPVEVVLRRVSGILKPILKFTR